jgi:hypothetical protein
MRGQLAFEAIGGLSDGLILEAAEALGFTSSRAAVVEPPRKREPSALGRFFSTGWGVALLCAVVSLTVLGGIIRAGQRPPAGGPGGVETETADYAGDSQTDVKVRHGDTEIYPQRFFLWATDWTWSGYIAADGLGFAGTAANDYGNQPSLPMLRYAKDGSISPCELTMSKKYEFSSVRVYDTDMQHATAYNYDGEFVYGDFLKSLATGRYYVVMEIRSRSAGYEYAFALEVFDPQADTTTEEVISKEEAMEIASAYWNIQSGETSPDNGFTYRIECQKTHVTPGGETVYVVLWRWFVDGHHWSTVDVVWVDCMTGEVIIPYEDLPAGS